MWTPQWQVALPTGFDLVLPPLRDLLLPPLRDLLLPLLRAQRAVQRTVEVRHFRPSAGALQQRLHGGPKW
jgi:hypothetical protein